MEHLEYGSKSTYLQSSVFENEGNHTQLSVAKNKMQSHNWGYRPIMSNAFNEFNKIEAGYKGTFSRQESPVETKSGETAEDARPDEQLTAVSITIRISMPFMRLIRDVSVISATKPDYGSEYSHTDTRSLAYGQGKGEVSPIKTTISAFSPVCS